MPMASAPPRPQLTRRRLQGLLRQAPPLPLTRQQFAAIQARVWARLLEKLDGGSATGH